MTHFTSETLSQQKWLDVCQLEDVLPNMGRCVLFAQGAKNIKGDKKAGNSKQVAIFKIITLNGEQHLYAIDNYCPFSHTNTLSRGITGNIGEQIVVASPLYKQHFDLETGQCIEDENVRLTTYPVRLHGNTIQLAA